MPPIRQVTAVLAFFCTLALFAIIWSYSASDQKPPKSLKPDPSKQFVAPYGARPLSPTWKQWFYPGAWSEGRLEAQRAGKVDKDWNVYYHVGGNGPWIPKVDGIVTNDTAPPQGCTVQQVHMLSRHAERYPTQGSAQRMTDLVAKIKSTASPKIEGDLSFLNQWTMFFDDPESQLEQLTKTGPYAGSLDAFMTGVKFRTRYHNLIEQIESTNTKVKLWTASGERVHDTASYFALGLFGLNANDTSSLEIIPESPTRGGNTLTPSDTCLTYGIDEKYGHEFGEAQMTKFRATYLRPIASRLRKQLEVGRKVKIDFSDDEVYAMQEMCGFETIARGKSPWCDVFSREEWESFEYARDVMHFYRTGPGNKYAKALGSLWLNATGQVLAHDGLYADGVDLPPFYFSFTHDSDVVSILATLDLFRDGPNAKLPVGQVEKNRSWRMSQVVPMGGRIVFERLACSLDDTQESMGVFIRLNINDGIIAIPGCAQGPGLTCPLKNFLSMLDEKLTEAGNFAQLCDLSEGYPGHITFLHQ